MKKRPRVPPTPARPEVQAPPQAVEIQIPTLQVEITNANVQVQQHGDRKILVVGPVALVLRIPFDTDNAKAIAGQLASGIEIPSGAVIERVGSLKG